MKAQFTLTVPEAKAFIAEAVIAMPEVRAALAGGRILLKGGTTVSAISERLAGIPLRVSGRITARGTVSSRRKSDDPHSLLLEGGNAVSVDDTFAEVAETLGRGDVVIVSANAIDADGNAATMAGAAGGGIPGRGFTPLMTEGATVIIPAGLEKLIPGSIAGAVRAAGRRGVDVAYGMAVGLMPITGRVVTEVDAAQILGRVKAVVIGRGGLGEAAGATTMVVEGEAAEVERVLDVVDRVKGAGTSAAPGTLEECDRGSPGCANHLACVYLKPKLRRGRDDFLGR